MKKSKTCLFRGDISAKFLCENNIKLGFSIDGYKSIHDKNRIYRSNGKGSFEDVVKGMKIYQKYSHINILSVVNTESDVNLFYQTIKDLGCYSASILLRDCHYSNKNKED